MIVCVVDEICAKRSRVSVDVVMIKKTKQRRKLISKRKKVFG